jgi:hypothetical protein
MTPKQSRFNPGDLVLAYHYHNLFTDTDPHFIGPYLIASHHSEPSGWSYTLLDPRDGGLHRGVVEGLIRPQHELTR